MLAVQRAVIINACAKARPLRQPRRSRGSECATEVGRLVREYRIQNDPRKDDHVFVLTNEVAIRHTATSCRSETELVP